MLYKNKTKLKYDKALTTLINQNYKIFNFLWLSSKYTLKYASHHGKNISVQSIYPDVWTEVKHSCFLTQRVY